MSQMLRHSCLWKNGGWLEDRSARCHPHWQVTHAARRAHFCAHRSEDAQLQTSQSRCWITQEGDQSFREMTHKFHPSIWDPLKLKKKTKQKRTCTQVATLCPHYTVVNATKPLHSCKREWHFKTFVTLFQVEMAYGAEEKQSKKTVTKHHHWQRGLFTETLSWDSQTIMV